MESQEDIVKAELGVSLPEILPGRAVLARGPEKTYIASYKHTLICETEPSEIYFKNAQTTEWLQAIWNCMKKVKLNRSTTLPEYGVNGLSGEGEGN